MKMCWLEMTSIDLTLSSQQSRKWLSKFVNERKKSNKIIESPEICPKKVAKPKKGPRFPFDFRDERKYFQLFSQKLSLFFALR